MSVSCQNTGSPPTHTRPPTRICPFLAASICGTLALLSASSSCHRRNQHEPSALPGVKKMPQEPRKRRTSRGHNKVRVAVGPSPANNYTDEAKRLAKRNIDVAVIGDGVALGKLAQYIQVRPMAATVGRGRPRLIFFSNFVSW